VVRITALLWSTHAVHHGSVSTWLCESFLSVVLALIVATLSIGIATLVVVVGLAITTFVRSLWIATFLLFAGALLRCTVDVDTVFVSRVLHVWTPAIYVSGTFINDLLKIAVFIYQVGELNEMLVNRVLLHFLGHLCRI
jgi:hypothetical protein